MTWIDDQGHVHLDVVRPDGHHEDIDLDGSALGMCECELDFNCGCGRWGSATPGDVLATRWSQDHP